MLCTSESADPNGGFWGDLQKHSLRRSQPAKDGEEEKPPSTVVTRSRPERVALRASHPEEKENFCAFAKQMHFQPGGIHALFPLAEQDPFAYTDIRFG